MLRLSRQKGLAAVEATIVLPVLLLLMLAIGEFGRVLYEYNTLTKAVRAGVRTMTSSGNPGAFELTDDIKQRTKNMIIYGQEQPAGADPVLTGLDSANISFSQPYSIPVTSTTDIYVEVHVSYDWQPIFGDSFNTFFGEPISLSFPLQTSMTMRVLQ